MDLREAAGVFGVGSVLTALVAGFWARVTKGAELRAQKANDTKKADAAVTEADAAMVTAEADAVSKLTDAFGRMVDQVEKLQSKVEDCEGHHEACRREVEGLKAARRRDRSTMRRLERELIKVATDKSTPAAVYTPGLVVGELPKPRGRRRL